MNVKIKKKILILIYLIMFAVFSFGCGSNQDVIDKTNQEIEEINQYIDDIKELKAKFNTLMEKYKETNDSKYLGDAEIIMKKLKELSAEVEEKFPDEKIE